MTLFRPLLAILVAMIWLTAAGPASAVLKVDITQGTVDPLPIAVPNFHPGGNDQEGDVDPAKIGADMARVITADLQRSGLFKPVNRKAFINATAPSISIQPSFADWRGIGTSALVMGQVNVQSDGRIMVQFRLWDVFAQQQMVGRRYRTTPGNWRQVAHMVSDAIYKRLTGEEGYFNTRIVYVAESGSRKNPTKRLAIMDQDGHNHEFLTDGDSLVLTPRFSPSRQEITYLSYKNNRPRVYLMNIDTGKREILGNFPGMTFAPRFAPSGDQVIMSMAESGNSEVYIMDLRTREMTRLTEHPAIDTSPSFAPDGSRIVFNSDRGGTQQLYVMDRDGGNVTRISFGGGRYATPVWSPRGDLIAFTKIQGGEFHIGVMEPDGSNERVLTTSYLDEGPTWAPNGRVLMFFRQKPYTDSGGGGETSLWSVDLTGYNERRVMTPLEASDPAWSPLIQ